MFETQTQYILFLVTVIVMLIVFSTITNCFYASLVASAPSKLTLTKLTSALKRQPTAACTGRRRTTATTRRTTRALTCRERPSTTTATRRPQARAATSHCRTRCARRTARSSTSAASAPRPLASCPTWRWEMFTDKRCFYFISFIILSECKKCAPNVHSKVLFNYS